MVLYIIYKDVTVLKELKLPEHVATAMKLGEIVVVDPQAIDVEEIAVEGEIKKAKEGEIKEGVEICPV